MTAQCSNERLDVHANYSVSEVSSFVLQITGGFDNRVYQSQRVKFHVTLQRVPDPLVTSFKIDFGNGQSQTLTFTQADLPITQSFDVDYTSLGDKIIRVSTLPGTASSTQTLKLSNLRAISSANYRTPSRTDFITGASFSPTCQGFLPTAKDGQAGTASIYVHTLLSPSNQTGHVRRPLIFLEGIDFGTDIRCDPNLAGPDRTVGVGGFGWDNFITGVFEDPEDLDNETFGQINPLVTRMLNDGYDIVFCDFADGADWIQRNGMAFIEVVNFVNREKKAGTPVGACFPNLVVGASMGGQVAKWALRTMEVQGLNHDAALYVSFDSPQQGANVALSVQSFIWFNANFGSPESRASIFPRWNALNRPAAQQLLVHHFNKIEQTNGCDLRQDFAQVMTDLGYPRNTRNIATANGSGFGTGQGYANSALLGNFRGSARIYVARGGFTINPGVLAANVKLSAAGASQISDVTKLTDYGIGWSLLTGFSLDLQYHGLSVIPVPNSNQIHVVVGKTIRNKYLNPILSDNITNSVLKSATLTFNHDYRNWDNAPGGNRQDISRTLRRAVESSLEGNAFENLPTDVPAGAINGQAFIPTISALDIQTGVDNVNLNIFTAIGGKLLEPNASVTPFAAIFFPNQNQTPNNESHVQISQNLGDFIIAQMNAAQVTLQSPLAEPYNYGLIRQVIPSVTIANGGILGINNNGRTAYVNRTTAEADASKTVFETLATSACDANIVVQNGGQIQLGANWGNAGVLRIGKGSIVTLESGSTLLMNNASQVVVEEGAKLIINAGANINLVGLASKITIKGGGELVINGANGTNPNFNFTGNGYFNFESGNILTLNNDWILRGSGKTTRLINIGHQAKMVINGGRRLIIQDALIRKEANISNQDVLHFNDGSTFFATNVTFDDQSTGGGAFTFISVEEPVDLDNSPTDMDYSFRNCAFNRSEVAVFLGGDAGGMFDFRDINVEFINTTFTNCQTAYYAQHGWETTFDNCTIIGGGISLQRHYWLQMRRTTMRGNRTATGNNATIGVKIRNSAHNWFTQDCLISDYGTGIDGFTDMTAADMNGNIRLEQATIQFCQTALNLRGGANVGLLYMDCARILENEHGIKGLDLLLMAYSRNGTANIFSRPANNPNSTFFETVFLERQETDISLFGTYWNNQNPVPSNISPTRETINSFWKFYQRNPQTGRDWPWSGNIFTDPIVYTNGTGFAACGGILPGVRGDAPVNTASAVVVVNGLPRDLRIQEEAAMEELEQGNLREAIELFSPVAAVNDATRNPANSAVRYFVDVARVMSRGESEISMRSNKNHWIPESLVEMPKEINNEQLVLSPNPANNTVNMTIKGGNYTLNVSNTIGQTIFTQNTEGSLSVDVSTWTNGIYLFEVTNKTTNKWQRSKIVVQH